MIRAGLAAVDAGRLVRHALAGVDHKMRAAAAVDVVAAGKAAGPMLTAFIGAAPVKPRRVIGIGAAPLQSLTDAARWHTTAHPVPDDRSMAAAREALDLATAARESDVLVVLLSGGASSMMALPADPVTLADKQLTIRELLQRGAEIHQLNAVRKHLSAIKGGWLAAANVGSTVTLALSDVVDDDLSSIASGPTVADDTTYRDTLAILDAYGGADRYPESVVARLKRGAAGECPETPKPGDPRLARSDARVIGGWRTAVAGAQGAAVALGYAVHVVDYPITGEARLAARVLVDEAARAVQARADASVPLCIVGGGETVVRNAGSGKGGRSQECALAMARGLDALGPAVAAACLGTDGIDGPTDAAGAIVDSTTLARAEGAGMGPPERYLDHHDSHIFFDELGDLIRTGPTGTNAADLQVILIG